MSTTLTAEDTKKLKRIIDQGLTLTQEISDLKEGFRDTVKAVAEELNIPAKVINTAIRTAYKASLEADKEAMEEVEGVLAAVGRA